MPTSLTAIYAICILIKILTASLTSIRSDCQLMTQDSMHAIRSFIAIELPAPIQNQLDGIITQLKGPMTGVVRWVPAQNIHLTLKFLGDVSPANIEILINMLRAESSRQKSFSISIGELGAFPSPHRPRVLWAGVSATPQLDALARLVESETRKLGYPPEARPFSPHLTLGRVSKNASAHQVRQVAKVLAGVKVAHLGNADIHEVVLFKSILTPKGAEYSALLKVPLQP
jgi:2'-5' RNA ligase